jgi:ribose transport system ATP-binding protein
LQLPLKVSDTVISTVTDPVNESTTLLRLNGIIKRFPGVLALDGVSFDVRSGEVHAVCGENGAGKSTLMKVISGQYQPDAGSLEYLDKICQFHSTVESEAAGIAIIHQELNLVPHLTVAENIYLAREPRKAWLIDRAKLHKDAQYCLDRLSVNISPDAMVYTLSVAQQQMVEIAKALSLHAKVLIMDEPTSSLTDMEIDQLFAIIHELKRAGVGIVYISHRLDELARIIDRVTVLRDGRFVSTDKFGDISVEMIVSKMVGRALDDVYPKRISFPLPEVLFQVKGLCRKSVFHDINFNVHRGEILGFAGLMGAGRTEVARAIFGADSIDAGQIFLDGTLVTIRSPIDAVAQGLAYLSEDRKHDGLALKMTVAQNITLANMGAVSNGAGMIQFDLEKVAAQKYIDALGIRTPSSSQLVRLLSGGNQQKLVISKWLFRESRVMFFDEPTRGIDVGAKYAIYQLLDTLASQGIAVVMISSELPEIMGMTDRVAVFHEGRIATILNTRETSQEEVMHYASGRRSVSHS